MWIEYGEIKLIYLIIIGSEDSKGVEIGYSRWGRLAILIKIAGSCLGREILHTKESLSHDGAQLYHELKEFKTERWYKDQHKVVFPKSGIIDERRFDISIYMKIIELKFPEKYENLIKILNGLRNHVYYMGDKNLSEEDFLSEWETATSKLQSLGFNSSMLEKLGFDKMLIQKLKIGNFKGSLKL